jgi:DNA-binding NarL/FixJ family response regulator
MDTARIRVLIVDDLDHILRTLAQIIENDPRMSLAGIAKNGYEAVAHVVSSPPDVIIMDIEMESKLAGLYAAREILKVAPQVKVIIYTRHNSDFYVFKAFMFGVTDYLIKETTAQDMIDTILRAHQNRSIIHPEAVHYLLPEFVRLKNAQENLVTTIQIILRLTKTELDILRMLHSGLKQQEIAEVRFIEMTTMKTHISNILKKFDYRSIAELLENAENTEFFTLIEKPE